MQAIRVLADGDHDGQPSERWPRFSVKRPYKSTYKSFVLCVEEAEAAVVVHPLRLALEHGVCTREIARVTACYAKDFLGQMGPALEDGRCRLVVAIQFLEEVNVTNAQARLIRMLRHSQRMEERFRAIDLTRFAQRAEPLTLDVAVFLRDAWLRIDLAADAPVSDDCKADGAAVQAIAVQETQMCMYIDGEVNPVEFEVMGMPLSHKAHYNKGEGEIDAYVPMRLDKKRMLKLIRIHSMVNFAEASGKAIIDEIERLEENGHLPMAENVQTKVWRAVEALKDAKSSTKEPLTAAKEREAKAELWKAAQATLKRKPCEWCARPIKEMFALEEEDKDFCSRECAAQWAGRLVCEGCKLEPLQMPSFEEAIARGVTSDELFKCECGGTMWPYNYSLARRLGNRDEASRLLGTALQR